MATNLEKVQDLAILLSLSVHYVLWDTTTSNAASGENLPVGTMLT